MAHHFDIRNSTFGLRPVPPRGNANFARVQHFIHHLAPHGMAGFGLVRFYFWAKLKGARATKGLYKAASDSFRERLREPLNAERFAVLVELSEIERRDLSFMAKIEDLVKRISDEKLRDEIAAEVQELKKHKQFGLVFEEHLPEMLRLPKVAIRVGNLVVQRDAPGNDLWRVIGIKGRKATCRQPINPGKYDEEKTAEFPLGELVLVVSFGEPIYPVLTPVDRIARGGPDKPWHVVINADNYHALQLLLYSCTARKTFPRERRCVFSGFLIPRS